MSIPCSETSTEDILGQQPIISGGLGGKAPSRGVWGLRPAPKSSAGVKEWGFVGGRVATYHPLQGGRAPLTPNLLETGMGGLFIKVPSDLPVRSHRTLHPVGVEMSTLCDATNHHAEGNRNKKKRPLATSSG